MKTLEEDVWQGAAIDLSDSFSRKLGNKVDELATEHAKQRCPELKHVHVLKQDVEQACDAILKKIGSDLPITYNHTSFVESYVFCCECESDEHTLVVKLWDYTELSEVRDLDDISLTFHVHLSNYMGFWKRLLVGLKYIFGVGEKYGHFDTIDIKYEDADRLIGLLHKFRRKVRAFNKSDR